jgi:hypothetical protein
MVDGRWLDRANLRRLLAAAARPGATSGLGGD